MIGSKNSILRVIKSTVVIACITLFFLEVLFSVWIKLSGSKINLPTYRYGDSDQFWVDANEDFGVIHLPYTSHRHKKSCFDVTYFANKEGLRDADHLKAFDGDRVIGLGDSFMEGLGVDTTDRCSNLLVKETGMPHLNFGLGGNFGLTQSWLMYETIAKHYDHSAVILFLLPSNDFIEDDYAISYPGMSDRYRPYFVEEGDSYKLLYHQDDMKASSAYPRNKSMLKRILKTYTVTYNVLTYYKNLVKQSIAPKQKLLDFKDIPGYYNYSEVQFDRLKYLLSKFRLSVAHRDLMLVSIPNENEIRYQLDGHKSALGSSLTELCDSIDIEYVDLLEEVKLLSETEVAELFLQCDGHWSPRGNAYAKDRIVEHYSIYNEK